MRRNAESLAKSLAQREAFLSVLTNAMPGMVAHWDHELRCTFANAAHAAVFNRSAESLLGMALPHLLGPTRMADFAPKLALLMAGEAQRSELCIQEPNGQDRFWQLEFVPEHDGKGQVCGFFVMGSDVTALRQSYLEQRMAASVFRSTLDGVLIADHEGKILSANPAFCKLSGTDEQALLGQPAPFARQRAVDGTVDEVWHALETRGEWRGEYWSDRSSGEEHLLAQSVTAIRNDDSNAVVHTQRYVAVYSDITERWRQDERVRQLALHDSLTGLPNRHLMTERLEQLVIRAARERSSVMLMFLDLDGFKAVNDKYGHAAGDELLQQVAARMLQQVRETDTVARLGGDEFVVLLDNPSSVEEAFNVANRILTALSVPIGLKGDAAEAPQLLPRVAEIGASIGLASLGPNCSTAALLARADAAMYAAKAAGKHRVHLAPS
jgi:diguanylate cyclase (GGDEF)-like protein/PAS domain S-box-containing protein